MKHETRRINNQTKRRMKTKVSVGLGIILAIVILSSSVFVVHAISSPNHETKPKESGKATLKSSSKSGHEAKGKTRSNPDDHQSSSETTKDDAKTDTKKDSSKTHESDGKVVYLTIDDGPSAKTDEILDTLQHYGAKATFFMLSPNMKDNTSVVKRMVKEGHGAGLHGVTHQKGRFYRSKHSAVDEMREDQETLEDITGYKSKLVRTPYGSVPYLTKPYRKALKSNAFKIWDWNVDSKDWDMKSESYVTNTIEQIKAKEKAGVRSIVLLHDKLVTAKYLPELLSWLKDHGFHMKKIDDSVPVMQFKCYDRCHRLKV